MAVFDCSLVQFEVKLYKGKGKVKGDKRCTEGASLGVTFMLMYEIKRSICMSEGQSQLLLQHLVEHIVEGNEWVCNELTATFSCPKVVAA
eukprot:125167-Ditylum_brightwellii.AAC.2